MRVAAAIIALALAACSHDAPKPQTPATAPAAGSAAGSSDGSSAASDAPSSCIEDSAPCHSDSDCCSNYCNTSAGVCDEPGD